MAHPGLQHLYGQGYFDEPLAAGANRSFGPFNEGAGRLWSGRNYKKILADRPRLPDTPNTARAYLGLFPHRVIAFSSECLIFYQGFPAWECVPRQAGPTYHQNT